MCLFEFSILQINEKKGKKGEKNTLFLLPHRESFVIVQKNRNFHVRIGRKNKSLENQQRIEPWG